MSAEIDKTFWYKFVEPTQGKFVSPDDAGWLKRDGPDNDNQMFCFVTGNSGLIAGTEIGSTYRPMIWTMQEGLRPGVYYVRLSEPPIDRNFKYCWFNIVLEQGKYRIYEPTKKECVGVGTQGFLIRWEKDNGATQLYTLSAIRKITPAEQKQIDRLVGPPNEE